MATKASGRKGQGSRLAAGSQNKPTSGVKTTHPPATQPSATTSGSSSGRSSTSPSATSHTATNSQELTWATVQSVRAQLGASHPIAVEVARLYSEQERNKEGIKQSLQLEAERLVAAVLQGEALCSQGRHSKGADLLKKAWSRAEAIQFPDQESVAMVRYSLARALHSAQRWDEALQHWQWLVPHCNTLAEVLKKDDPQLRVQVSAAHCLFLQQRFAEAETFYERAWEIKQRRGGLDDVATSTILQGLLYCRSSSLIATSDEHLQQMLQVATTGASQCTDDMHKVEWLNLQSMCQIHLKRYEAADRTLTQLLPLARRVLGANDPRINGMVHLRTICLAGVKQGAKAQSLLLHSLQNARRQYGAEHPNTVEAAIELAAGFQLGGKHQDCLRVCEEVWESAFRVLGPEHRQTGVLVLVRGTSLLELNREQDWQAMVEDAARRGLSLDQLKAYLALGKQFVEGRGR